MSPLYLTQTIRLFLLPFALGLLVMLTTTQVAVAAVSASFKAGNGVLSINGDDQDNTIVISRTPAGKILVNNGAIRITGREPTVVNTSLIRVLGRAGNDHITLDESNGALPPAHLYGGPGDDTLTGGSGADSLFGGPGADTLLGRGSNDLLSGEGGDDVLIGGDGDDELLGGAGDDVFVWNPGDDNDIVEGGNGTDTLLFNGANVAENIDIAAIDGRVLFFRNVASVTMDLDDVEQIDFNARGGADTIVVNDLSGSDVTEINLNLVAVGGGGDAQPDTVIVNGTNDDDVVLVFGDASSVDVLGLPAQVNITGAEAANDRLIVNALAGNDVVEASGLAADAIQLTADGGDGDDVLIGGDGNDVLLGGPGDDVLLGGPGIDVLDGGPGDNIVIQG